MLIFHRFLYVLPEGNAIKISQDWSWPFAASGAAGAGPEGDAQFEASRALVETELMVTEFSDLSWNHPQKSQNDLCPV